MSIKILSLTKLITAKKLIFPSIIGVGGFTFFKWMQHRFNIPKKINNKPTHKTYGLFDSEHVVSLTFTNEVYKDWLLDKLKHSSAIQKDALIATIEGNDYTKAHAFGESRGPFCTTETNLIERFCCKGEELKLFISEPYTLEAIIAYHLNLREPQKLKCSIHN